MSRNTIGTYTLHGGNPVVSGSTITTTWANNTLNDIAVELTNSLDRQGRGAMLAPLQHADGSSTQPAVTFANDPDSGLYRAGAGDVRMQVNASQAQQWTATGTTIPGTLTASGGATISGTNAISGTTSITGAATINTTVAPVLNSGGPGLVLKPGSADHVYAEFYADSADSSARSGYLGYPTAGSTELTLANQMAGGDVRITSTSGNVIVGTQQVKMQGGNPASTAAMSNALTAMNVPKAWALVTVSGSSSVSIDSGFNVTSATIVASPLGFGSIVRITFASAFANTSFGPQLSSSTPQPGAAAGRFYVAGSRSTTTLDVLMVDSTGAYVNPATNSGGFMLTCFGAQ